jgi:Tol biopolymer transport system component
MSVIALPRPVAPPRSWRPLLLFALLAIVLVAGAVIVGSRRTLPEPFGPARNGLIAYASGGDIFLRDPANGATRSLVEGVSHDVLPEFSPDGTRLLYLREVDDIRTRLFVVAVGGGAPVEVSSGDLVDLRAWAWSPDSTQIAYASLVDGFPQVTIAQADGSAARTLDLGTPADYPAWRPPDGRELVVRLGTGTLKLDLAVVSADGTSIRPLGLERTGINNPRYEFEGPAWSPDGTRIAYQTLHPGDIFRRHMVNADGSGNRQLTKGPENLNEGWNLWSPDGSRIGFGRWIWDQNQWLAVEPADGGTPAIDISPPLEHTETASTGMTWAPDGRSIVANHNGTGRVMTIDPFTGVNQDADWTSDVVPSWQRLAP